MAPERIDPSAILSKRETYIVGRPTYKPHIDPNHQIVAYISPDKKTPHIPLICETLGDMESVYNWYYAWPTRSLTWGECEISEHLADRQRIDNLSALF